MVEFQREGNYWDESVGRYVAKLVCEKVEGASLLDLGCGDGILTSELCKCFPSIVGVERYTDSLHKAQIRCPSATFYAVSIERFIKEWKDEPFDVVTILLVLEHLPHPVETLKAVQEIMKPDARLFIAVPNANAINKRIGLMMGEIDTLIHLSDYDKTMGNLRYYDRDLLRDHILDAGLRIIDEGGCMFKTLSSPQMEWLLTNGKWGTGEFGWGDKDAFIRGLFAIGEEYPEDCNIIYAIAMKE